MQTRPCRFLAVLAPVAAVLGLAADVRGQAAAGGGPGPGVGVVLHVSPEGRDAWSGRLAAPNGDGTDGPLTTLQAAQARVRDMAAAPGAARVPVTVLLRGGTYALRRPLVFTAADSGTAECPVTFAAFPGEQPVLSGGALITGWQPDDSPQSRLRCAGKLWRADLPRAEGVPAQRFSQLFVNGERRPRARIPNAREFLRTEGPASKNDSRRFRFREGDLKPWPDLREALVVVYHSWEASLHHIRELDTESCVVTLHEPAPWAMGFWEKEQRYYVENVFEGLDAPGEWYLDPGAGRVYYYPLPGEDMARAEVIAPRVVSTLVEFRGEPAKGAFVEHVRFRGIAFRHTNSELRRIRNPGQGEVNQPGLIHAVGLRHASFADCEIANTGAHGIWLAEGCSDVRLERCHIHDLGGGGVYIGTTGDPKGNAATQRITVDNCFIHDGSHQFRGAHGVWIGRSSYNTVTHNEIADFDYSGISCGWSWGFQPSSAHHNILDYNHIHHLGNGDGLSDMGAIYTLGISPGTTERRNHIHDVYNYAPVSHGSGIYPDEGSSEILIEGNVVYRVRTCPLFQHYGKDNLIRNNIFAFGGAAQLQRCREDVPCHYTAECNLVYADIPQMLGGVWKNGDWKLARNLYWSTAGAPVFAGVDFAAWQAAGNDAGSVVADPLFVDPERGDFRLQPGSPAFALGFEPVDAAEAGLYGDRAWVELPPRFPNRARNEVPPAPEKAFVLHLDFEAEPPGTEPLDGVVVAGENGASITVSDEAAAGGAQSLKFTDAAGQQHDWTPHIFYRKTYVQGRVLVSWDMLNTREAPASFYVEVRQYGGEPYRVGPTVTVTRTGKVTASGREVGEIPLGEWVRAEIALTLGEGAPGTYQLTLAAPGRDPIRAELPWQNSAFREIHWLGVSSTTTEPSIFYIDNLKLGTPEELSQPPVGRPRARRPPAPPRTGTIPNDQALAGHWPFDEGEGYTARDSSGCGNDADVWANWARGPFGTALACDQTAHSAIVRDDPTLRLGTGDFTLELWLFPTVLEIDSPDPRRRFLSKDRFPKTWWNLNLTAEGKPLLEMVDENRAMCNSRGTGAIPAGAWTHLAVVVDRTSRKVLFYYNGSLDSSHEIPGGFTGSLDVEGGDLSLGCSWQPFVGLLDDVRVFRRALSPEKVRASCEKDRARYLSAEYELVD